MKTECENQNCDIRSCNKRHPRPCKFFINYGRCKFSPCSYSHKQSSSPYELNGICEKQNIEIRNLKKQIEEMKDRLDALEKVNNLKVSKSNEKSARPLSSVIQLVPDLQKEINRAVSNNIPQLDGDCTAEVNVQENTVHGKEKCSTCELYFYSEEELLDYMKENSITYVCDVCQELFISQWEMNRMYPAQT